jgi:hypothetical protein
VRAFSAMAKDARDLAEMLRSLASELEEAGEALGILSGAVSERAQPSAVKAPVEVQPAAAPPKGGSEAPAPGLSSRKLSAEEKEQIRLLHSQSDKSKEARRQLAETYRISPRQVAAVLFNDMKKAQAGQRRAAAK